MEVHIGDTAIGSIPKDSISALYFCIRELGFHVDVNWDDEKMMITSGLKNKTIVLEDQSPDQNRLRNVVFEGKVLESVENILLKYGTHIFKSIEHKGSVMPDISLSLIIFQLPDLKQPVLELYHSTGENNAKWIKMIKNECKSYGIKPVAHETEHQKSQQKVKLQVMLPQEMELEKQLRKLTHIISIGLLSKLQGEFDLSALSMLPIDVLLPLFQNQVLQQPLSELDSFESLDSLESFEKGKEEERHNNEGIHSAVTTESLVRAEAYFDYHVIIHQPTGKGPKIFGDLFIKNSGTVPLKNPCVCFRVTPVGSVQISGQILPPKAVRTQGIQTAGGAKGWKYMTDNWIEDADEKGEIWIQPIQEMIIHSGERIKVPNIQMKINNPIEYNQIIKVEAFIFFIENGLEIVAENKISLMVTGESETR